ncbi:MAG: polymer-forming cytoskeletal protein [Chloroflexi bacterium]|nr:polymer-forming cytoskeletal protein [Chloroflexota bacterium]
MSQPAATPMGVPAAPSVPSDLTLIARADRLEGTLKVAGTLRVQGTLEGTVESSIVHIDEGATVKADITADEVIIGGEYSGKLVCRQRLEIRATGVVVGQVQTFRLMLHEGGSIDGELKMLKQPATEDASARAGSARGARDAGPRSAAASISVNPGASNGQAASEAVAAAGAEPIG